MKKYLTEIYRGLGFNRTEKPKFSKNIWYTVEVKLPNGKECTGYENYNICSWTYFQYNNVWYKIDSCGYKHMVRTRKWTNSSSYLIIEIKQ